MELHCGTCGRAHKTKATPKGNPRTPPGWKHHEENYYCPKCWGERYVLRAITVPVAFPVGRETIELWRTLQVCWQQATELSNFAVTELARDDYVRDANDKKLPVMKRHYLYPAARLRRPDVTPQTVVSILQAGERRYREKRYDVLWRASERLPTYRYPVPYPVHNQSWSVEKTAEQGYVVHVRLNGESWDLKLRGGHQFYRQRLAMDKIIAGTAIKGELALYRRAANTGDHRSAGVEANETAKARYRIMCKMVAWLPREQRADAKASSGTLLLKTSSDCLWIAATETLWTVHADTERQWVRGHTAYLERSSEDLTKLQQNAARGDEACRRMAQTLKRERQRRCEKYANRIKSACQMWSAAFARFAARQHVESVTYNDSVKKYFPHFDWTKLRLSLEKALDDHNIKLVVASAEPVTETPGTAREGATI